MNYLHNMINHDPFHWSFRDCASMEIIHGVHNFKKHKFEVKIVNELKAIYDQQKKDKKWFWQKFKSPVLGSHKLSISKEGIIEIDGRPIVSDDGFIVWLVSSDYKLDLYNQYKNLFDLASKKIIENCSDIEENYEFYCSNEKSSFTIGKLCNLYLTMLSALDFVSGKYSNYDDIPKYKFKWSGKYNEPYLLAEKLINEKMKTSYDFASVEFDESYNKKLSDINFSTASIIVDSIKR